MAKHKVERGKGSKGKMKIHGGFKAEHHKKERHKKERRKK